MAAILYIKMATISDIFCHYLSRYQYTNSVLTGLHFWGHVKTMVILKFQLNGRHL